MAITSEDITGRGISRKWSWGGEDLAIYDVFTDGTFHGAWRGSRRWHMIEESTADERLKLKPQVEQLPMSRSARVAAAHWDYWNWESETRD